ncbi:tyrosine-type recombinase/integrase [Virgibacillus sp. W0430]|uniref:tyrosine-type recombinase/integrase n=1 Tax=Virgibacillus sp. W0430 TaxID=3391580 RepID=UPI003F47C5BD
MAFAKEVSKGKKYRLFAELGILPNGKRERRTKIVEAGGMKEARKLARDFENDLMERLALNEDMFLSVFVDKWIENYASVELAETTLEKYENTLEYIVDHFRNIRMGDITSLMIIEFFNKERKEKRGSLESKYKVLQSLFKHAIKWSVIKNDENPMDNVEKPKNAKRQENKDFYRQEEIKQMLQLIQELSEEQQLIVQLALIGGLRRGEITAITHDVLDFTNNTILIKRAIGQTAKGLQLKDTKTENIRTVTLPKHLMEHIHNIYIKKLSLKMELGNLWKGHREDGKELIFLFSDEYGKPYRPDSITQFWNRFTIRHKDNLRRIRFHDLRHSSATYLLSEGINMKIIQKRLGHKNIKTTLNLYSHVTEKDDEKASDLFNNLL